MVITNDLIESVKVAAKSAGALIMKGYGKTKFEIKKTGKDYIGFDKIQKSLVTDIDIEAQKIILKELMKFNNFSVYAEEKDAEIKKMLSEFNPESEYGFIIDPLDGTSNYLSANPKIREMLAKAYFQENNEEMPDRSDKFGICISLAKQRVPLFTLVFYPKFNQILHSIKDQGAFINGKKIILQKKQSHSFSDAIRISQYSRINEFKKFFTNRKSYQSASYNLKALIEGDIISYCIESVDYLDFCPTLLTYVEAGGFLGDEHANQINVSDLVRKIENGRLNQFMILSPSKKYCESLLNNLKSKGLKI